MRFTKEYLAFSLVIIWQLLLFFRINRFTWEHGIVEPWFVTKGLMFYKDFSAAYTPLPKILIIPINLLTGWNIYTTVVLAFIQVLLAIWLIFWVSGKLFSGLPRVISLFFFGLWFSFILKQNTFEMNLLMGMLILLLVGLLFSWFKSHSQLLSLLIGVVTASAIFSTQHTALVGAIILLIMCSHIYLQRNSLSVIFYQTILPYLMGLAIVSLPITGWFYLKGSLYDLYFWTVDYYLRSNAYPFNKLGYSLNDLKMLALVGTPFIILTIYLVNLLIGSAFIKELKKGNIFYWQIASLWLILLTTTIPILGAVFHPRRFLYVLPLLSLLAGWMAYQIPKTKQATLVKLSSFLTIPLLIYSLTEILPWYKSAIAQGTTQAIYDDYHRGDNAYETVEWLTQNTNPNSKILVFDGNPLIYFKAQRLPSNNRTYPFPWVYEPFDQMKLLLQDKPPDYWVVDERLFRRFYQWGYSYQADYIRNHIDLNFRKIISFDWMSVYERKKH